MFVYNNNNNNIIVYFVHNSTTTRRGVSETPKVQNMVWPTIQLHGRHIHD